MKEGKKIWKNEIKRFSSSGYYIICLYSKTLEGRKTPKNGLPPSHSDSSASTVTLNFLSLFDENLFLFSGLVSFFIIIFSLLNAFVCWVYSLLISIRKRCDLPPFFKLLFFNVLIVFHTDERTTTELK